MASLGYPSQVVFPGTRPEGASQRSTAERTTGYALVTGFLHGDLNSVYNRVCPRNTLMATTSTALAPQSYGCSFPGCPVPVRIHISLIETLQGIARNEAGDRQGILYGQTSEIGTVVGSSRALAVFEIEDMHRAIAEAHDPVPGYYRIREGNSLELTTDEINLAETLFARPGSVVLLVERREGCPQANFFFLEDGKVMNFPLLEFPLDAATLTEREAQRARRTDMAPMVRYAPEPPPSSDLQSSPPAETPKPVSERRPVSRLWTVAIVILVAAASFSAALFLNRPHSRIGEEAATRSTLPEARASLHAERQGEDVKIMWDLNSPAVAGATSGVLDIDDGGTPRRIPMTADQVRFGSVLYSPVSDQISVRLTTLKDDQSTAQESVLVLLKRPPQAQADNSQTSPRIPFEVKTERVAPTRSSVKRDSKPSVERRGLPPYQPIPQHVDQPAPLASASASPPPVSTEPRSEPAKPTVQTTPERVDPPVPLPVASGSPPPAVVVPRSEPVKPATQPIPDRVDPPASLAQTSAPAIAAPRSEPAKPREEAYVAPVLISQQGARMPRELLPILTHPVAVSVRVEVNETGRVTHAEAIPEKGIHALLLSSAADAARHCRFQPARRGQSPVPSTVTMVFHIGPGKE
jgi:periplasmic protein TonB